MSGSLFFRQCCPTCGRNLRIRLQYLGRHMACPHCGRQFLACDQDDPSGAASRPAHVGLLDRANALLEFVEHTAPVVRAP